MPFVHRKLWLRRPPPTCRLDWEHPVWNNVGGVFLDCGGVFVDLVGNRRPTQLPTYALVDTPAGPGLYFNNSGSVRFAQNPQHSHADSFLAATTGEFSAYGRYFHVANGAAYNSLISSGLPSSPYTHWGAEADGSGGSLVAHVRSTSGARASTPAQGHGFVAGTEHSIAMTSSVSAQVLTLYADTRVLRTATVTSHYFDPAAGFFQMGSGVRGSLYLAAFWHRTISTDDQDALDEYPWLGILPESTIYYSLPAAGAPTQDASHTASGGASSGGAAESSREAAATGSGGATAGGSATSSNGAATQDASHTAGGGASSGGSAAVSREAVGTGFGGANSGGQATQNREAKTTGSGGAVSGGSASTSTGLDLPAAHGSGVTFKPVARPVTLAALARPVILTASAPPVLFKSIARPVVLAG